MNDIVFMKILQKNVKHSVFPRKDTRKNIYMNNKITNEGKNQILKSMYEIERNKQ